MKIRTHFLTPSLLILAMGLGCGARKESDLAKAINGILKTVEVPASLVTSVKGEPYFQTTSVCSITETTASQFSTTCTFTSDGTSYKCLGSTYTWKSGTVTFVAVRPEANLFETAYTISATLAGGNIDGDQTISGSSGSCKFNADHDLDAVNSRLEGKGRLEDKTNFSCTIGETTLSYERFKDVFTTNECSDSTTSVGFFGFEEPF